MTIVHPLQGDLIELEVLWKEIFNDTTQFAKFVLGMIELQDIYLIKEDGLIVAFLTMGIEVSAHKKTGVYLYGVGTRQEYRKKGYARKLIEYAATDKAKNGAQFIITQPATDELFNYYENIGFSDKTYLRVLDIEIKRNLWAVADFDTITAVRFKDIREKFKEEEILHFSNKYYQKFTEYLYSTGGSTVETKDGYAIYFIENNRLIVREILARSTQHAHILLQAIRERTGIETATIELSQNSILFLGEGKLKQHTISIGQDEDMYANLLFD